MTPLENNFRIEELRSSGQLSERAFNCCRINKIKNLSAIIVLCNDSRKARYLLDFDQDTATEFQKLNTEYNGDVLINPINKLIEHFIDEDGNFPYAKYPELQKQFNQLLSQLSRRTRGFLAYNLAQSASKNVLDLILDPDFNSSRFKPVGVKTEAEIAQFRKHCRILTGQEEAAVTDTALEKQFWVWFHKLSSSAKGGLSFKLKTSAYKTALHLILDEEVNLAELKRVGEKSAGELQELRLKCLTFINQLQKTPVD